MAAITIKRQEKRAVARGAVSGFTRIQLNASREGSNGRADHKAGLGADDVAFRKSGFDKLLAEHDGPIN
jgi:hypothetical protein